MYAFWTLLQRALCCCTWYTQQHGCDFQVTLNSTLRFVLELTWVAHVKAYIGRVTGLTCVPAQS